MKMLLNFFMTFTLIGQASTFLVACDSTPSYIDNNKFENINGIDSKEHIEQIAIKDNIIYTATTISTGEETKNIKIYQTNNNNFQEINTENINKHIEEWEYLNISILVDHDNNLLFTVSEQVEFNSVIYKYNQDTKEFEEKLTYTDKYILGIFLNKFNNNDKNIYFITEKRKSDEEFVEIYKLSNNSSTPEITYEFSEPDIKPNSWTFDNNNNIYMGALDNDEGKVFKISVDKKDLIETLEFPSTPAILFTSNNTLYIIGKEEKQNNVIYQLNQTSFENKITTSWEINSIVIDENNHLFAGGANDHLYSSIINGTNLSNLQIISNQNFKGINVLNYEKDILFVGSKNGFFTAKLSEFKFS